MSWWDALILGVIQGATEFLPVSSSGHLVLAQELLDSRIEGLVFEVSVHVATLLSILLVYRQRVTTLVVGAVRGDREAWRYIGLLVIATVPAAIVGLSLSRQVELAFDSPWVTAVAFLGTGAWLWSSRWALRRPEGAELTPGKALLIGLAQALALVPGISRSGATVVAGLWLGLKGREAAAFSFLMAVPAIAGAAILQLPGLGHQRALTLAPLLTGVLAAALTGILAIRVFVSLLERGTFHRFALYVWGVGLAFMAWLILS